MRYIVLAVFLFAPSACAAPLEEAPEGNYDLVAVEVVHTPENVVVGDEVVFANHLTNQGTDAIPPAHLSGRFLRRWRARQLRSRHGRFGARRD